MTFIKSPCSSPSRITFLDVVGEPTKLVIFIKKKDKVHGYVYWSVTTIDKTTDEVGTENISATPSAELAQICWESTPRKK